MTSKKIINLTAFSMTSVGIEVSKGVGGNSIFSSTWDNFYLGGISLLVDSAIVATWKIVSVKMKIVKMHQNG